MVDYFMIITIEKKLASMLHYFPNKYVICIFLFDKEFSDVAQKHMILTGVHPRSFNSCSYLSVPIVGGRGKFCCTHMKVPQGTALCRCTPVDNHWPSSTGKHNNITDLYQIVSASDHDPES